MKTIKVIYDGSTYTLRWLKGLFCANEALTHYGYKILLPTCSELVRHNNTLTDINHELHSVEADVMMIALHHSGDPLRSMTLDEEKRILIEAKSRANKLVWLDTADSTGTCRFEVLPYVDRYLKKQVLKNKDLYRKPIWGGRVFCEYYHNLLNLDDEVVGSHKELPLDKTNESKLGISWNVGIGDMFGKNKVRHLFPRLRVQPHWQDVKTERTYDIHFRGTSKSPVAGYQRQKCRDLLDSSNGLCHPDPTTIIPKREYECELRQSRAILSPFGWGEICTRDFESFANGSLLVKPSMEHLDTYPNMFIENKTYFPLDWDFSNYTVIEEMLESKSPLIEEIAGFAQSLYKHHFSEDGNRDFARHIVSEIEK